MVKIHLLVATENHARKYYMIRCRIRPTVVGQGDLATIMGIAQNLVETVRKRERDHADEKEQFQWKRVV